MHHAHPGSGAQCLAVSPGEVCINFHFAAGPVASLLAGIVILVMPRVLSYIVAFYLIIVGLMALTATTGYL
jgi:hypothetical protein